MDRLATMRTFVGVVDAGSFALAAARLGLSRSMVTRHVGELEKRLGVTLLERTTRRLAATVAGKDYYRFCCAKLRELEQEDRLISRLHKEPRGALKILGPTSFGEIHVSAAVAAFARQYPSLDVSLVLDDAATDTLHFTENGYDIAIRPSFVKENTAFVARKIGTLRRVICASPEYIAQHGMPRSVEDLRAHNCLVHLKQAPDRIWRLGTAEQRRFIKIGGSFSSSSPAVIRRAALSGMGIALLSTYYIGQDLKEGRLQQLLKDVPIPLLPVFVLYSGGLMIPKKARLFGDFLAKWYKSEAWSRHRLI